MHVTQLKLETKLDKQKGRVLVQTVTVKQNRAEILLELKHNCVNLLHVMKN